MDDHALVRGEQEAALVARELRSGLQVSLLPLLALLDAQLDRRLVRTVLASVEAILAVRHRAHGLLLSELGAYLAGPAHAPAGTKRLSNLLRSGKWGPELIEDFLWQQAEARRARLAAAGEEVLAVWDERVLEKPESQATPDLCPVRWSKAGRLTRSRGRKAPPSRPVFVPGLHWLGLLLVRYAGTPTLASMRWWTTHKLLLLTALAYACLLALLPPALAPLRPWLLRHWCHRTGRHAREAATPLSRLRSALSRLRSALSRLWLATASAHPTPGVTPRPG